MARGNGSNCGEMIEKIPSLLFLHCSQGLDLKTN